ncbi:MAG: ATP-binding protein [Planctomycetota bacterium]
MEAGGDPTGPRGRDSWVFALPNELARVDSARARVRSLLAAEGVDEEVRYAVDLVIEELAGNVLRHGFHPGQRGELVLEVELRPECVVVVLLDDGRAFDPTRQPEPPRARSIADARIGGLGLRMVRLSTRAMRYRREEGRNRIEVEVAREPSDAP